MVPIPYKRESHLAIHSLQYRTQCPHALHIKSRVFSHCASACRCCIHWKVFEVDRTNIFDRIIAAIGAQVEQPHDAAAKSANNGTLCYWLTNTVTLLLLLQKNLKPAATPGRGRGLAGGTASAGPTGSIAAGALAAHKLAERHRCSAVLLMLFVMLSVAGWLAVGQAWSLPLESW